MRTQQLLVPELLAMRHFLIRESREIHYLAKIQNFRTCDNETFSCKKSPTGSLINNQSNSMKMATLSRSPFSHLDNHFVCVHIDQ